MYQSSGYIGSEKLPDEEFGRSLIFGQKAEYMTKMTLLDPNTYLLDVQRGSVMSAKPLMSSSYGPMGSQNNLASCLNDTKHQSPKVTVNRDRSRSIYNSPSIDYLLGKSGPSYDNKTVDSFSLANLKSYSLPPTIHYNKN